MIDSLGSASVQAEATEGVSRLSVTGQAGESSQVS
jgi:hypothetical protein